jgi:hypothetical protein
MQILLNPRDNGACPVCRKFFSCPIRRKLGESIAGLPDASAQGLEVVIYTCPRFVEKF